MAEHETKVPKPSPEQLRVAVGQYERAKQVMATGNFDYAIQLLMTCCKLDPTSLIYRKELRKVEKGKYKNNMKGSRIAFMKMTRIKARLKTAQQTRNYLTVLETGEEALAVNPWDTGVQLAMAEAANALGLIEVGIFILDQARQKNPMDHVVNRAMAHLCEKNGNYSTAAKLWELVRKVKPLDDEAQRKCKDLAATDTILRGNYDAVTGQGQAKAGHTPGKTATVAAPKSDSQQPAANGAEDKEAASPIRPATDRIVQEIASFRKRVEADPTNVNTYLALANAHRKVGQLDQVRAVLEEGLAATGNHFELSAELAELDIDGLRRNLAAAEAKLKNSPNDEQARGNRNKLRKEINSRELELFRQKSDRFPTNKNFRFELGVRLYRAGQVEEAIGEFQGVRGDPKLTWRSLHYLGLCFESRQNWRLAQRNFEEALQNVPPGELEPRKDILYHLATGHANSGDLTKALQYGYDLANQDYNFRDIGKLLEEWQKKAPKDSAP